MTRRTACAALMTLCGLITLAGCPRPDHGTATSASTNTAKPADTAAPQPVAGPPPRIRFELASNGLPTQGQWKCRSALRDLDGDGHLDLAAISRLGNGANFWLGDGKGNWKDSSKGLYTDNSCGGGVEFGDINEDGKLDLVVADHCRGLAIYLGDGKGNWERLETDQGSFVRKDLDKEKLGLPSIGFEDCAVGDVDKDGHLDIVAIGSFEGGINVFHGDGTGRKWKMIPNSLPTTGWANEVVLTDVTGDGILDIVTSYSEGVRVWAGDGKGGWEPRSDGLPSPSVHGLYMGVAVGDFNADGRPDIAAANWFNDVEMFQQNENGSWKMMPAVFTEMVGGANGVGWADLDGDGHLDLIVSGRKTHDVGTYYGVWVFLGDGKGGFELQKNTGLPETGLEMTWNIVPADVDEDGRPDFLLATGGAQPIDPSMPKADVKQMLHVWLSRPAPKATAAN